MNALTLDVLNKMFKNQMMQLAPVTLCFPSAGTQICLFHNELLLH